MRQTSRLAWLSVFFLCLGPLGAFAQTACPPGPYSCTPWGPPTPTPPAPPPPAPWHPGPVVVIEPDVKVTNKALPDLIRATPEIKPLGVADKLKIQGLIGERIRFIEPGKSYYWPQEGGKGFVFRGAEIRQ